MLQDINTLKNNGEGNFKKHINLIKDEAMAEEVLFSSEEFDIFGSITEDKTKLNTLGNIKHREIKKSKFRLLEINKNTKNEQYVEVLKQNMGTLDKIIDNAKLGVKLNAFLATDKILTGQKFSILYIRPEEAIETMKDCEKINLYNIKLKENTKAVALTNIVYYDNTNKTLPVRNEYI